MNLFCRAPQSLGTTTLCSGTRKLPIGAGMLQLLTPVHLEPVLRSKRSPRSEACCPQEEQCPPAATRESPWVSTKTQGNQKLKAIIIINNHFSILFCSYSFPGFDCLSAFFGVPWASWWVYLISLIICHLFHHFPMVSSHVSCPGRTPGHLLIPKHSLELWRLQAWL